MLCLEITIGKLLILHQHGVRFKFNSLEHNIIVDFLSMQYNVSHMEQVHKFCKTVPNAMVTHS
jgi:hypothetical protein